MKNRIQRSSSLQQPKQHEAHSELRNGAPPYVPTGAGMSPRTVLCLSCEKSAKDMHARVINDLCPIDHRIYAYLTFLTRRCYLERLSLVFFRCKGTVEHTYSEKAHTKTTRLFVLIHSTRIRQQQKISLSSLVTTDDKKIYDNDKDDS